MANLIGVTLTSGLSTRVSLYINTSDLVRRNDNTY